MAEDIRTDRKIGFTLTELLVGIIAVSILLLTVGAILVGPIRAMRTNEEYARIRRDIGYAMAVMGREVRAASFSGISVNSNVLAIPANEVRPQVTGFQKTGDSLEYLIGGSKSEDLILNGVHQFSVTRVDVNNVQGVRVRLEIRNDDGSISIQHESFIHARN